MLKSLQGDFSHGAEGQTGDLYPSQTTTKFLEHKTQSHTDLGLGPLSATDSTDGLGPHSSKHPSKGPSSLNA